MEPLGPRAQAQHGLIHRSQAAELNVAPATFDGWVGAGRLVRVHPALYRMAGAPVTWEQWVAAAVLAAGEGAVASHRSAARLWNLHDDDVVEITVPQPRLPRLRDVVVHRSADLDQRWASRHRAIPVTTPARTLVDLGAVLPASLVEDALDRALAGRLLTVAGVEHALDALGRRGRRGAGVIRGVVDGRALGAERPDGLLEPRMARLLRDHGLPPATFQFPIGRYRADFAYPAPQVAIEVDGFACHGSPRALQADLERQNALVAQGWTVLRFTWTDVVSRPGTVARTIRQVSDGLS